MSNPSSLPRHPSDDPVCPECGAYVREEDAVRRRGKPTAHWFCVGGPACALCGEPTVAEDRRVTLEDDTGGPLHGQPAHATCAVVYRRRNAALPAVESLCDGIVVACAP